MADFEVHIELDGRTRQIGLARSNRVRGTETVVFEYEGAWLDDSDGFSLEPALAPGRGTFVPPTGLATFLLGVADATRLGALRFRWAGDETFQAPIRAGVPALIELGRLLQITERIFRDEETDEDLQIVFAPGSSLGGARPKASVIDQHGHLSIAKFPKETDDYSMETWEEIALRLAGQAGHRPHSTLAGQTPTEAYGQIGNQTGGVKPGWGAISAANLSENPDHLTAKVKAAWRSGLATIVCIGETRAQRRDGNALNVCRDQLPRACLT